MDANIGGESLGDLIIKSFEPVNLSNLLKSFREEDHPRDAKGRFTKKSGSILNEKTSKLRKKITQANLLKKQTIGEEFFKLRDEARKEIDSFLESEIKKVRKNSRFKTASDAEEYVTKKYGLEAELKDFDPVTTELAITAFDNVAKKVPKLMNEIKENIKHVGCPRTFNEKFKAQMGKKWSLDIEEKMVSFAKATNPNVKSEFIIRSHVRDFLKNGSEEMNKYAYASTNPVNITFGDIWKNIKKVKDTFSESILLENHAKDNFSIASIIEHEFGHHIVFNIQMGDDGRKKMSLRKFFDSVPYEDRVKISEYGTSNDDEFFAETFVEFLSDPENKREDYTVGKFRHLLKDLGYI